MISLLGVNEPKLELEGGSPLRRDDGQFISSYVTEFHRENVLATCSLHLCFFKTPYKPFSSHYDLYRIVIWRKM